MLPQRFIATPQARERDGGRLDRLGAFLLRSDPLADDAVDAIAALPHGQGWRILDRVLREGITRVREAPEPFRALFAQLDAMPVWADAEAIATGGALLLRTGVLSGIVLAFQSLALSYCSPGGNKPLVFTGRLRDQAARRLDETARFVHAVSLPGGMARGGEGFATAVKVRLIHAQVRRMLLESGRWRTELWGHPINQHDMGAANLLFSASLIDGLRKLGVGVAADEAGRFLGLWRYAGWVLGVDPELLCATEAEAVALAELVRDTQGNPDEHSRALIDALVHAGVGAAKTAKQKERAKKLVPFHQGVCRALIGDALADGVRLPRGAWRFSVAAVRPLFATLETARRLPLGDRVAFEAGRRYWAMAARKGMAASDFGLPNALAAELR